MPVTPPDWLSKRGGALRQTPDGFAYAVVFTTGPQYVVTARPTAGKFSPSVTQTINGRRLEAAGVYPTEDDAVRAVKLIEPKKVMPIHFNTWDLIAQDAAAWGARVKKETKAQPAVVKPGEWVTV